MHKHYCHGCGKTWKHRLGKAKFVKCLLNKFSFCPECNFKDKQMDLFTKGN